MGQLVSSSIPNLISGVSQQPQNVRLPTQGEEQVNCFSSVTDFLKRRPAMNSVARLMDAATARGLGSSVFMHPINRDEREKYLVLIYKDGIKVFDLDGTEKTVTVDESAKAYLAQAQDPMADFRAQTINDHTFIVNRRVTVKADAESLTPKRPPEALVFIKQASYNTTYTITLDGVEHSFTTADGVAPADQPADPLSSSEIAAALAGSIKSPTVGGVAWTGTLSGTLQGTLKGSRGRKHPTTGNVSWGSFETTGAFLTESATASFSGSVTGDVLEGSFTGLAFSDGEYSHTNAADLEDPAINAIYRDLSFSGSFTGSTTPQVSSSTTGDMYQVRTSNSTVWIRRTDGKDFKIAVSDTRSNTHTSLCKGTTQRFSDLLTIAPRDFVTEVIGDASSSFDNYYVRFEPMDENSDFGTGLWKETVKPGIPSKLDAGTMPHGLIRQADGTFTFGKLDWAERACGDEDSAPLPSFVDRTINGLFFYRNRLAFLSEDNVVMSETGEFFNFFVTTVTTMVDSDVIDVAASNVKSSLLQHAAVFSGGIILFSDQTQFTMEHDTVLANATVSIKPVTEFEADMSAAPVSAGKTVFFATRRGEWGGVREYLTLPDNSDQNDAADVTAHVPRYITGGIFKLICSTNEDLLLVLSRNKRDSIWLYKYYWNGSEKIQSAWSRWDMAGTVLSGAMFTSKFYCVMEYDDGVWLEVCDFAPAFKDPGEPIEYCLDRKVTEERCMVGPYDQATKTTTITLPWPVREGLSPLLVTRTAQGQKAGVLLDIVSHDGDTVTVRGDASGKKFFAGIPYRSTYTFSQQAIREESKGNAITTGRLQLRSMTLNCDDTGYLEMEVTPSFRQTSHYIFTGRELGHGTNVIGNIPLYTGKIKVPVLSLNTQVSIAATSASFLPFALVNASWEGFYNTRHRQV